MNKKISVVTICYNSEAAIKRTVKSIVNQTYKNIEYIIKDGCSTDNTVKEIETLLKKGTVTYQIVSKRDEGIYDAMNQAIDCCTGDWIIFMNAGDIFFNTHVIEDMFNRKIDDNVGIIYGHTMYDLAGNLSMISNHNLEWLDREVCYCHQAIFARKALFDQEKFSLANAILGDYEWLIRIKCKGVKMQQVNCVVCRYARDGISAKEMYKTSVEECMIHNRYYSKKKAMPPKGILKVKERVAKVVPIFADLSFAYRQMRRINNYAKDNV